MPGGEGGDAVNLKRLVAFDLAGIQPVEDRLPSLAAIDGVFEGCQIVLVLRVDAVESHMNLRSSAAIEVGCGEVLYLGALASVAGGIEEASIEEAVDGLVVSILVRANLESK